MIRTSIIPHTQMVSFAIPLEYIGKEVEILVFAKNEGVEKKELPTKCVSFTALSLDTTGFRFNRDEANER